MVIIAQLIPPVEDAPHCVYAPLPQRVPLCIERPHLLADLQKHADASAPASERNLCVRPDHTTAAAAAIITAALFLMGQPNRHACAVKNKRLVHVHVQNVKLYSGEGHATHGRYTQQPVRESLKSARSARDKNCLFSTSSQWLRTAASSGTTSILTRWRLLTPSASATAFRSERDCSFFSRAAAMHAAVNLPCLLAVEPYQSPNSVQREQGLESYQQQQRAMSP
jgi:hypothetical protein